MKTTHQVMRVKGRKVEDVVDVYIDAREVLKNIYEGWIPAGMDHVGVDGYWHKKSGFDYHRREHLYERVRKATSEELEFTRAYQLLYKFVGGSKLV